jgi:glutamate dehydrogenase
MNSIEDFDIQFSALLDDRRPGKDNTLLKQFAARFWLRVPLDELRELDLNNAYGATLMAYRLMAHANKRNNATSVTSTESDVKILISNPDYERDGWHSPHTVVLVVHRDMPFITDSILLELSHHDLTTHSLQNLVLNTRRENGELEEITDDGTAETLIYAEIDRINIDEFADLDTRLREVLTEVRQIVTDFEPMKHQVDELLTRLDESATGIDSVELSEAKAFLSWLSDDHFTFLGYREFKIAEGLVEQVAGSELGLLKARRRASSRKLADMPERTRSFILKPELLSFSKSGTRSRVHRHAYPDYIAVKLFNDDGEVVGECGFLGLYTSIVYSQPPETIPVIARKVQRIFDRSELDQAGFNGKVLAQVIATHPRDELFQASEDELFETAIAITHSYERSKVKLFVRAGRYGLFYSCLVYIPRELHNTQLRISIQELLINAFGAIDAEFYTYMSESILVRTQIILRVHPMRELHYDVRELEAQIINLTRDWSQDLQQILKEEYGEQTGRHYSKSYLHAFPASYQEFFSPRSGFYDVKHLDDLDDKNNMAMRFYRKPQDEDKTVRLKIFHLGDFLPLSDIVPMLENLGMRVIGEHPYQIHAQDHPLCTIQDFNLLYSDSLDLNRVGDVFEESFIRIWYGDAEDDGLNRLVLATRKNWRQISILRAYSRYLKQIRLEFSQKFIADTLLKHVEITSLLIEFFILKFSVVDVTEDHSQELDHASQAIRQLLENVSLLNEDRILRRYLELMENTFRTNFFQHDSDGRIKPYISLKIDARNLSGIPEPKPNFEIFVYSPRVEGVHLRFGEFARGGLRWSDRQEDYRTEVLGLAKAQSVKNALIVPNGAKGGFVLKRQMLTREAIQEEGIACYRLFVSGLLDVTDNLIQGEVAPPTEVVRFDGDDPYLVVAADKGTATFSDTANKIAESHSFWLGDAFASGGSNGYDHKAMGITAKGAWISVQRHFREQGIDVQKDAISVIGIGDMSGDVFGNGVLLSRSIKVVAAFNHMHIFVDPSPDPETSYIERQRLFQLPRSGWSDYDENLISKGGGIFSRLQKSIPISEEMKALFDISQSSLAPDELINSLLKAPVDLIWNGGIGTYVKASGESSEEVGDRSNDTLRVLASEIKCRVFGEGGNLGMTQKARIEYSLLGGRVNTDFIDNSAGVDCSDHEVNIKILLNQQMEEGELTLKQRNKLLVEMTDEVSELVLDNNYRQAQVLSLAQLHGQDRMAEYIRLINTLVTEQKLNRDLEYLPTDEQLTDRAQHDQGLTRPELAVLLSYAKLHIKNQVLASNLDDYENLKSAVLSEFPMSLREQFSKQMEQHPLRREIIATQIANDIVHHMGISFVTHLKEYVGSSSMDIVQAYSVMIQAFRIHEFWRKLEKSNGLNEDDKLVLQLDLMKLGRRATRWVLRHYRALEDVQGVIDHCQPRIDTLRKQRMFILGDEAAKNWQQDVTRYVKAGCPPEVADVVVGASNSIAALTIIEASEECGQDVIRTAEAYAKMGEALEFDWLTEQINKVETQSHWQAMERDALLDEFMTRRGNLAADLLKNIGSKTPVAEGMFTWLDEHLIFVENWNRVIEDVQRSGKHDFALYSMTSRKLGDLISLL